MATDEMALKRIDHVRFFVGNARQSAYFYRNAFGFDVVAYAGLETGVRHEAGYVLRQGEITFVLASPLRADHPDAQRLVRARRRRAGDRAGSRRRGRGVRGRRGAGRAAGVAAANDRGRVRRLRDRRDPRLRRHDAHASSTARAIAASSRRASSRSIPTATARARSTPSACKAIDHIVANVEEGKMGDWVDYYSKVMGFSLLASFDDKDISTEYSALMSKVVADGRGRIKFPDQRAGQGPAAVADRGVPRLLRRAGRAAHRAGHRRHRRQRPRHGRQRRLVPAGCRRPITSCCPSASARSTKTCDELAELGILVDRDDEGYLLQIFTKPVEDRPTLFFEIIQRRGAQSFGKGNFKALFEAIEREQARRGTL